MSFMKKGLRQANRKVKKDVSNKIMEYSRKFEFYGEIAHKLSLLFNNIDESNIDKALTRIGYEDLIHDDMAKFLILGQTHRNYVERDNEKERIELSGRENESTLTEDITTK